MGDLSEHFSKREFACGCGCGFDAPSGEHIRNLEKLRDLIQVEYGQRPIVIASGNRCRMYNKQRGGALASRHMEGDAADIIVPGLTPDQVAKCAEQIGPVVGRPESVDGFGGIGVGWHRIHVDSRPRRSSGKRSLWTYSGKKFDWRTS